MSVVAAALWLAGSLGGQAASLGDTPGPVVINEVAWGGTAASTADEWIELFNNAKEPVDVTGWQLSDGNDLILSLSGLIAPRGYFLLERSDDSTVSDVMADQIYTGILINGGERLELRDGGGALVDTADGTGGWPAGTGSPHYASMERIVPHAPDLPANWTSNNGAIQNGLDSDSQPIRGTPGARNSGSYPNLSVSKTGPEAVAPGGPITYTVTLSNAGPSPAVTAWLTDRLPPQVVFLSQTAPFPFSGLGDGILLWDLGMVPTTTAASPVTFTVSGLVDAAASGLLTNWITVTSASPDGWPADNRDSHASQVGAPATSSVLIDALYPHTYGGIDDEAFRLVNTSASPVDLAAWTLSDGEGTVTFPPGAILAAGQGLWCARDSAAFYDSFGISPDYEWDGDDPAVPDMGYSGSLRFNDDGDDVSLRDDAGEFIDLLVYGDGTALVPGWTGPGLQPYHPTSTFAQEGQILYRKRDQSTGLPLPDSDTAHDWAQDMDDPIDGCRVQYPGWDLEAFFFTEKVTEWATLTVAVAPDHLYNTVASLLAGAQETIQIESYTFRSRELAETLIERLDAGVAVTLLLEGAPAFDGVTDEEAWIVAQLRDHGAQVLFMINDPDRNVHDRYAFQHAKLILVDGQTAAIGSENLNHTGMPADDKANGTAGRRGVYLVTDAPGVVGRFQAVFDADADPGDHADVVGCDDVPDLCTPPPGYQPHDTPDWITYTVQFTVPLTTEGLMAFEVVQAPENSLRTVDSLLGLIARAGPGDTVLVEQFYERRMWGVPGSDPLAGSSPNLRLEACVDAARRGATVRVLLDGFLDVAGDNALTAAYLRQTARDEGLDLEARLGNPAHLGVHNKMVLVQAQGRGYVHAGSINGSEASSKVNRELALQVQSDAAYDYLEAVFAYDWDSARPPLCLPLVARNHVYTRPAGHLLVSEVHYALGKEGEWVEIVNPTDSAVDLSFYKVGDAQAPTVFEGMYLFPQGTVLQPGHVLVVASAATGFNQDHPGEPPDFELYETDPQVPNLYPDGAWGTGEWHLRNEGDEVLLISSTGIILDVVVYGDRSYPGVVPHPGVSLYSHSLERYPARYDTDDCSSDFRDWPFPNPGELPEDGGRKDS